jgi:thiamine biosynthesis protein ThiS
LEPRESTAVVTVHLNGKNREVPEGLTVYQLLEHLDLNPALVVVELNRKILDRSKYAEAGIRAGDEIELVHFVGGG